MARAVRCPVCYGKGSIPDKYSTSVERKCHGCNGKGWVEVSDEPTCYPTMPYLIPETTWAPYYQPRITYWCRG